ncbi:hypothetical protein WR25_25941 [Diploscapter pachys]|uniref:Polypeptide N-acetylgalactosaminyltransferase n=1 Tax=Diploscapter pachys TaxID=2018661 RepID=A0A2A2KSA3_9BILA|nr:hypothetical protein WR25_25941 [Diploscapter pachys]
MLSRYKRPLAVFISCWLLITIYFFGRLGSNSNPAQHEDHHVFTDSSKEQFQSVVKHVDPIVFPPKHRDFDFEQAGKGNDAAENSNNEQPGQDERRALPAAMIVPIEHKQPVVDLDVLAVLHTDQEKKQHKELYEKYQFNGLLSDRIGYRRKIPDTRNSLCPQSFNPIARKVSIIVCYFNESPSVLIRMVNSIIDRSPLELIQEILLIDDSSEWPDATLAANDYKEKDPMWGIVKLIRTTKNEGLIRAKVFGAKQARGDTLLFLDSHCEVNEHWLEPLLERIQEDNHRVVCPIIDIIDSETMRYVESPVCKGGFNWGLTFKWDYPHRSYFENKQNFIKPMKSATMAGGLFAIDKDYFFELGTYDEGMDIWGAENVEISFRIWMCGGELEILPCSRVGHIFRKKRPYGLEGDSMGKNSIRAARVWMDEYLPKFFEARPHLASWPEARYGSIATRVALRENLHCKAFKWYLENIYPELLPDNVPDEFVQQPPIKSSKYLIKLKNGTHCLAAESSMGRISKGARVEMRKCNQHTREQQWRWTSNDELRPMGSSRLCLDSLRGVTLMNCHNQRAHQEWQTTVCFFWKKMN